jgi:hypothetical protein
LNDAPRTDSTRHPRGALLLAFGLLSLVPSPTFVLGLVAWIMGSNDLKAMAAGKMDRGGERITRAARILGGIGFVGYTLWILKMIVIDGVGKVAAPH